MIAPTRRTVLAGLAAAAPLSRALAQGAAEAPYPARNIALVVPFAPGGSRAIASAAKTWSGSSDVRYTNLLGVKADIAKTGAMSANDP